MMREGTPNAHLDPKIRKLGLSDRDVADLVAFLEALSGDERPALGELPSDRPERVRIRVMSLDGKPVRRHDVTVRPSGDRFRGTTAMPAPFTVTTDGNGYWIDDEDVENGTVTFLLVEDFTASTGTDLDTNNDGVLDLTPWTRIVDDIAVTDLALTFEDQAAKRTVTVSDLDHEGSGKVTQDVLHLDTRTDIAALTVMQGEIAMLRTESSGSGGRNAVVSPVASSKAPMRRRVMLLILVKAPPR